MIYLSVIRPETFEHKECNGWTVKEGSLTHSHTHTNANYCTGGKNGGKGEVTRGRWRVDLTVRANFWHWRQLHTTYYTATHPHTHSRHTHTQSQGSSLNYPTSLFDQSSRPRLNGLVVPRIKVKGWFFT